MELMIQRHHPYPVTIQAGGFNLLIQRVQCGNLWLGDLGTGQAHTQHFIGQPDINQL
ncbi:hypothetical protein D3C71_1971710 [compost metagenome]